MDQRSARDKAAAATGTAVHTGGTTAGAAAQRAGAALQRAGAVLEHQSAAVAPEVGAAVGSAVGTAVDVVGDRLGTVLGTVGGSLSDFLDEPAVRSSAALDALRGVPVGPPASVRRWPWAVGAALFGAAAGAAVAFVLHRLQRPDAPGAQEPHELRAVVDLPPETGSSAEEPAVPPAAPAAPLPPPA